MKSILLFTSLLVLSFSAQAQANSEEIAMIQNTYGIEKRKLVADYMEIPQAQAVAFWSTYDRYEIERRELGRERFMLIEEYSKNYTSLTDEKADELAKGILSNNLKLEKFHQSYYSKFKKATSAKTAAQFLQLEIYLQGVIRSEIQNNIPFIGEVEKLRKH
jgi:hypothetical protein